MAYQNPELNIDEIFGDEIETKSGGEELSDYNDEEEVYFAFIDVLGFKKTFEDIEISGKKNKADKYSKVFNYYFNLMNAACFMEQGCYAGQTSDSLYFYTTRTDYLLEFMKIYSHFSLYAMSQDVFFRGGIAKGNLYRKAMYQFYGNSVIRAFLLESEISKNPVVVIDEKTNADMKETKGYGDLVDCKNKERIYLEPFACLDKDMQLAVKNFVPEEIDSELIRANIAKNRQAFEYDSRNFGKYVFLQKKLEEHDNQKKREE